MQKLKSKVEMQTLMDDAGIFTEISRTTQVEMAMGTRNSKPDGFLPY